MLTPHFLTIFALLSTSFSCLIAALVTKQPLKARATGSK